MIYSRPQTNTFVSLLIFLVTSIALLGIQIAVIVADPMPSGFNYVIAAVLAPMVIFVSYRVFFRYKKITMGDGMIEVKYPLIRLYKKYALKEIVHWKESVVKTSKNSQYKELEIKFADNRIIQMGLREYTEYDKMAAYLTKKIPGLRKSGG